MIRKISRRFGLKLLTLGTLLGFGNRRAARAQDAGESGEDGLERLDRWGRTHDRVFLGGDFWANPMEDWRIEGGWAVCQNSGGRRSVHSLTRRLTNADGSFTMTVRMKRGEDMGKDRGGGFRIGINSDIDEYKSSCFAGNGIDAGVRGNQLVLSSSTARLDAEPESGEMKLTLTGGPEGGRYPLKLEVEDARTGKKLGSIEHAAQPKFVVGNVAVVSQFDGPARRRPGGKGFSFTDWRAGGDALAETPEHRFGPILWTMYSLSDSRGDEGFVLKLSVLVGPMGKKDEQNVELQVERDGEWKSLGEAELDTDAWVATFRLPNWDESRDHAYRVRYREQLNDGSEVVDEWGGNIKANPAGRPLRIGALTCQNDYAFPYAPVAENLVRLDPDMLYFSGDQLYESHGGFGVIRKPAGPAILNYLRKFYQHGWAFREAMKDRPTFCIPDDHDVFQGNYWGEGGEAMEDLEGGTSSKGGYIQPVRMVNAVHRTCTAHHPEPYDPEPIAQGMSVYYGEVVYGGVGFAILGDRQFKSGPRNVDAGEGRADHVSDPDFDTSKLDKPGLVLLGERQEKFLDAWGDDWRGHSMKILLSQTPLAGLATHHGQFDNYLKADLDSNSWPQTPRNRAIDILRKSMALHVNGDQHLTTFAQYGVEEQRDSNWSFCTPAIAVGYARWWRADEIGMEHENRPSHGNPNTGEFVDGFGNKAYLYAVGNPIVPNARNRYEKAHQKGSGFGLVTVDTEEKTYTVESYRFLVDATDGTADNQFPGWPATIHQRENRGENVLA